MSLKLSNLCEPTIVVNTLVFIPSPPPFFFFFKEIRPPYVIVKCTEGLLLLPKSELLQLKHKRACTGK